MLTQLAPEYIERGRTAVLQRYMADIPPETMCDHPELILYAGMALHRLGQLSAATVRYEEARRLFADRPDPQGVCRALIQLAEVARAQGDYVRGQVLASQALDHAPEEDHASRAIALMALARCEGFLTGMDRGRALAEASVAAARQADDAISPRTRADLLRALGHICWWSGDPGATVRFCQEALQSIPDELSPIAANAYITMATPYTYWCDVDTALDCAQRGLEMVQQMDLTELLPRAYATLGAVMTKRGELDQGERYLRQAIDLTFQLGVDTYAQIIATGYLASNLVAQDRIEEARQVAETALWTQGSDPNTYEIIFCRSMLADIALAQGHLDEAETIFLHLRTVTERRQFRIPLAMIDFGLAYLRLTQGREAEGLAYGRSAISVLEPIGTIQLFLDQGHRARIVCRALESSGDRSHFVAEVLDRLSSVPSDGAPVDEDHTVGLRVHCLGPFRVFIDGEEIPAERWDSVKARDLLAYFIHFRHARVTIEMALLDLWADDDGAKKTAFHSALYRLRQAIRHETPHARPILVKGGDYWLDANWISVDVDDFDRLIQRARSAPSRETAAGFMETAVDLYEGEYLSSLRYYDWAMAERRRLAEAHIQALCALAEFQLDRGCPELALGFVRRALHHDPLREEVHTTAMRAHAALGDRDGLVRQHRRLASILAAELELEPLPETERLYQVLLHDLESA